MKLIVVVIQSGGITKTKMIAVAVYYHAADLLRARRGVMVGAITTWRHQQPTDVENASAWGD